MDTPFPFGPVMVFGYMAVMLLIGMLLRASIKFFQNYLIPSCFIGGTIGLILVNTSVLPLSTDLLETFAYHLFVVSFISLGLTTTLSKDKNIHARSPVKGSLWIGLVSGITMSMQGIIGVLFVFLLNAVGFNLNQLFGFLSPLGFTQGPGQALSVGKVWEEFGFTSAATLGLSFAVLGFAFAFFVGVPLVNWGIRKGFTTLAPKTLSLDILKGVIQKDAKKEPAGELTTHSGNIECLAFHAALVGLVYLITYGIMYLINSLLSADVALTAWGFFFFLAVLVALLVKLVITKIGLGHLLDPGVQRRITGWAIDFLIIATIMAIQLVIVWEYIVPILLISLASGILTTLVVVYIGRRTWEYSFERTVGVYGIATGTATTALLLLRIADPEFETPVALELGIQVIFAAPFVFSLMMLMHAPLWWGWSVQMVLLVYIGIMLLSYILLRVFKFLGPRKF
ncbi:MAG: sodium/glutamate symporter [Bacillota bacterium]|nr:sodium/glutamate symporter [Bacillota bacterium]